MSIETHPVNPWANSRTPHVDHLQIGVFTLNTAG